MITIKHLNGGIDLFEGIEDEKIALSKLVRFLENALRQKENLSILIGSGCSSHCIPLMGNTMKDLQKNDQEVEDLVSRYIQSNIDTSECSTERDSSDFRDIEALLNWVQNGVQYLGKSESRDLLLTINKIKTSFINTIPIASDPIYFSPAKKCKTSGTHSIHLYDTFYRILFSFRRNQDPKVSIFTTNYDLFNEYALENNNIQYTTGFSNGINKYFNVNNFHYRLVDDTNRYKDRWQPTNKSANLYKIHGSINWKFNENTEKVEETSNDMVPSSTTTTIYPTAMKHLETAHHPYSELFREFSIQLQKPNSTLIVIGYGFPDEHINNIISQNINNDDFNLIILGNETTKSCSKFYSKYRKKQNVHLICGETSEKKKIHYFETIVDLLSSGTKTKLDNTQSEKKE